MQGILSTNLLRQLTILKLIIKKSRSTRELSGKLRVSDKTIRKDIVSINNIISPLKVSVTSMSDYEVKWLSDLNDNYINACFYNASIEFQILEKILLDETNGYNELADAVFISVSTLRRAIARMNKVLVGQGIEIISNPVRVRGNEREIINFLSNYLEGKFLVTNNFLSSSENKIIDSVLEDSLPIIDKKWSFSFSETIKWIIKAHVIRMKNGNLIESTTNDVSIEVSEKTVINKLLPYHKRLDVFFGVPLSKQFIELANQSNYALTIEGLTTLRERNLSIDRTIKAIEDIVKTIENGFCKKKKRKEKLILKLYNQSILVPNMLLDNSHETFIAKLKNDKPFLFKILSECYYQHVPVLKSHQFARFSFCLVTEWGESLNNVNKEETKMRVGLFFSTTDNHIEFLKIKLKKKLNNLIAPINLNGYKITGLDDVDVDLILTNVSNLSSKKRSIYMSNYPDEEDLLKISRAHKKWVNQ